MKTYAALPMMFEENHGQTDPNVKFLSRAPGYTLLLTENEAVLALPRSAKSGSDKSDANRSGSESVLRLKFAGANTSAAITGQEELPGKTNYLLGNDPKQWRTNVPNYAAAQYRDIYPGVDAIFRGNNQQLEFDFTIAPGANPKAIELEVQGAQRIRLDHEGNALLRIDGKRDVVLGKPHVYQESRGGRRDVAGNFVLGVRNHIGFALGPYDHSQPLVIDPTLTYSSYVLGVQLVNGALAPVTVAVDSAGNAYIAGTTLSSNLPNTGGYLTACPGFCTNPVAFVMKLDPNLPGASSLIYATYLGPNESFSGFFTYANAITVDANGDAFVAGQTNSAHFPTLNGLPGELFSNTSGTSEYYGYATELNPGGTGLIYSTYIGGSGGNNVATGIAVQADTSEILHTYVTGYTTSGGFIPISLGLQPVYQRSLGGTQNAFVTEFHLTSGGTAFDYVTYLGGNGTDVANGIAVDSTGSAYVVGSTTSTNFPVNNAYQAALITNPNVPPGDPPLTQNAFFSAVAPGGTGLNYSTYLGGTGADVANAVAASLDNKAYITGNLGLTGNPQNEFPVTQNTTCTGDCPLMFVAKMDPSKVESASLIYSTYLGGIPPAGGIESAQGIAVDALGDAFVTGWEDSAKDTDFPLAGVQISANAIQQTDPCIPLRSGKSAFDLSSCSAGFLVEFSPDASSIIYSTFLGVAATLDSSGNPVNYPIVRGTGIALDLQGDAYVAGLAGGFTPMILTTPNAYLQNPPDAFTGTFDRNAFLSVIGGPPSPPFAQYSNIGPIRFGPVNVGATYTQSLILTNTGSSAFMVNGVSLSNINAAFTITSVICNSSNVPPPFSASITLAAGGTCTINLQFLPTVNGNGQAELLTVATTTTNSNASAGPGGVGQAFLLAGDAVEPFANYSPATLSFGNVNVNTPATQTVTVSNTGTGPLTLQLALIGPPGGGFSYTQVVCNTVAEPSPTPFPITLSPAGSCTFTVQFDPATAGPLSGTLGFADNAGVGESNLPSTSINGTFFQQIVSLSGTGFAILPPPPAVVSDNEMITVSDSPAFPDISDSESIIVTDTATVTACQTISILPASPLPVATVGTLYTLQFSPTGLTWTTSGSVPPGLTMNSSTGILSGTPTGSGGTFNFTVTVAAANGCPGSSTNVSLTVIPAASGSTTTAITSTSSTYQGVSLPANLALAGNLVPVTVNFSVQAASGTPTGTVKVTDGFGDSCSGALASATGSCALTISQLGTGSTLLTATYTPGANSSGLLSSVSSAATENIVEITACGFLPSIQTSAQGTTVTFTFMTCSLLDVVNAPQAVVTGCPPDAQCNAVVTATSGKLGVDTVVVTIVLGSSNIFPGNARPHGEHLGLPLFWFCVFLAMLAAVQMARQNRARPRLLYAAAFLMALLLSGLSGCSNASNANVTPPNTYTVNVTVTAGTSNVTVPLTMTVTK